MEEAASEIYDFIFKIDRRIGYLEKDLVFIEKKIHNLDIYKEKMYFDLHENISAARTLIEDIKGKLKTISIGISNLSIEMKDVVKMEQADTLSKQVDELPIDEYITRKEFNNMFLLK